ncbi:MAG: putative selenate ABC transporter substrate-binding protein, partial [Planctomycetota bacterium]
MSNVMITIVSFLALLLVSCTPAPSESNTLRFTAIPDQNTTELKAKFEPIAAYLAEKLGVEV